MGEVVGQREIPDVVARFADVAAAVALQDCRAEQAHALAHFLEQPGVAREVPGEGRLGHAFEQVILLPPAGHTGALVGRLDLRCQPGPDGAHRMALERVGQGRDGIGALGAGGGNDAGVVGLALEQARVAHGGPVQARQGGGQGGRRQRSSD